MTSSIQDAAAGGFEALALSPAMQDNLRQLGYTRMTAIQAASLPVALLGRDLIAQASTGSGKTAAFGLALLANLNPRRFAVQALVLCPTRELADQVTAELRRLARAHDNVKIVTLCGGVPLRGQAAWRGTLNTTEGRSELLLQSNLVGLEIDLPPPLAKTTLPFGIRAVRRITVITITGRRPNLELVQFVPLGIGTIPIRNGKQLANAATNINWLWIIHGPIMNHSPSCVQYSRKTKVAGFPIRPYNSSLFSSLSHVVQKSPDLSASSQS